jgi:hypothetical protein
VRNNTSLSKIIFVRYTPILIFLFNLSFQKYLLYPFLASKFFFLLLIRGRLCNAQIRAKYIITPTIFWATFKFSKHHYNFFLLVYFKSTKGHFFHFIKIPLAHSQKNSIPSHHLLSFSV